MKKYLLLLAFIPTVAYAALTSVPWIRDSAGPYVHPPYAADLIGFGTSTPLAFVDIFGKASVMPFRVASSSGASFFEIEQSGNVGIGTSTALSLFVIATSTSNNLFSVDNTGAVTAANGNWIMANSGIITSIGGVTTNIGAGGYLVSRNNPVTFSNTNSGAASAACTFNQSNGACTIISGGANGSSTVLLRGSTSASANANSGILFYGGASGTTELGRIIGTTGFFGLGTSTPTALLSLQGTSGSASNLFTVASSTNAALFTVDSKGHQIYGGTSPTVTSCGATPSVVGGNDNAVRIVAGTGVITACTVTFANTWTNPPVCDANVEGGLTIFTSASSTASSVTITGASAITGDTITVQCHGY